MVHRQWRMLGAPNDPTVRWSDGARFAQALGLKLPTQNGSGTAEAVNAKAMVARAVRCATPVDVSLMSSMLSLHPQQRWTAQQGLAALRQVLPDESELTREIRAVHRELALERASSKQADGAQAVGSLSPAVGTVSQSEEAGIASTTRAAAVVVSPKRTDGAQLVQRESLPRDASDSSIDLAMFDTLLDDIGSTMTHSLSAASGAESGGRSPRPRSRSRSPRSSNLRPRSPLLFCEGARGAELEHTAHCLDDGQREALRQGIAKWSAIFAKTSRVPQSMRTLCARYAIPDALALRCLRDPTLVRGRAPAPLTSSSPSVSSSSKRDDDRVTSERPAADDTSLVGLLDDLDDLFPGECDVASK